MKLSNNHVWKNDLCRCWSLQGSCNDQDHDFVCQKVPTIFDLIYLIWITKCQDLRNNPSSTSILLRYICHTYISQTSEYSMPMLILTLKCCTTTSVVRINQMTDEHSRPPMFHFSVHITCCSQKDIWQHSYQKPVSRNCTKIEQRKAIFPSKGIPMQRYIISSELALEILQSCTKPMINHNLLAILLVT